MAGKGPAGLGISGRVGQLGRAGGVLGVGMTKPILHKGEVVTSVQEVGGNGVLRTVPLVIRGGRVFPALRLLEACH